MKPRVDFKAYRNGQLVLHTWAVKGTVAETVERDVYQKRLDRGDFNYVDVIEPQGPKLTTLLPGEQ